MRYCELNEASIFDSPSLTSLVSDYIAEFGIEHFGGKDTLQSTLPPELCLQIDRSAKLIAFKKTLTKSHIV